MKKIDFPISLRKIRPWQGGVVVKTATLASNVLIGPLFDVPYRLLMGMSQMIIGKSSQKVLGTDFTDAAAQALIRGIRKREEVHNGVRYKPADSRPIQGGFALISEEAVGQMLEVLTSLGLRKFEDSVPVDFFIKPTVLLNQEAIAPTPIESEIVFKAPMTDQERIELLFRVVIMDPLFVDEKGGNLNLTQLPEKWVEQVLNTMNPAAYFKIAGQQLPEMFKRAMNLEAGYKGIFATMVKKWQGRAMPKDIQVLKQYLSLGLLHEFTHALALHLPDRILSELPKTEQERLGKFSVSQYLSLISSSGELQQSVVFVKNLIKALTEVKGIEPSAATQNQVTRIVALEMFCDRFSMFMYETSHKLQIYHEALPDFGDPFPIEMMRKIELERKSNPAGLKQKYGISDSSLAKVAAVETEHVYISAFDDPAILDAERAIFDPLLELLRHFDREKSIMGFTEDHTRGDFFVATKSGTFISEEKIGTDQIVEQSLANADLSGPVGLSLNVAEAVQESVPFLTAFVPCACCAAAPPTSTSRRTSPGWKRIFRS